MLQRCTDVCGVLKSADTEVKHSQQGEVQEKEGNQNGAPDEGKHGRASENSDHGDGSGAPLAFDACALTVVSTGPSHGDGWCSWTCPAGQCS